MDIAEVIERFYSKIEVQEHGCWYWTDHLHKRWEYGAFWMGTYQTGAHQASYLLHTGGIPDGHQIDHLCKIPYCVNPDHLEAVTQPENARRSDLGWYWELHDAKKCGKGHDVVGDNVLRHKRSTGKVRLRCRTCWNAYNKRG